MGSQSVLNYPLLDNARRNLANHVSGECEMRNPTADTLSAAVSGPSMMAHAREFAKRIKLSGTPEELESFHYLQQHMASFGYSSVLLAHDAYISLPGHSRVEIDGQTLESITHSFSHPAPSGGLAGDLVHLRQGTAADFAGKDLREKIVLVEGIASPSVAARASAAGAAGQLHISPNENRYEMCVSPVWGSPSYELLNQIPTTVVCTISNPDGAALKERLRTGPVRAVLHAQVDTGWRRRRCSSPISTHPAAPPTRPLSVLRPSRYLVLRRHGQRHRQRDDAGSRARPRRTSRANGARPARVLLVRPLPRPLLRFRLVRGRDWNELEQRCVAHVNVDSTGGIGANDLPVRRRRNSRLSRPRRWAPNPARIIAGKRSSRSSDASFWGVGIPSMFGRVSHQSSDPGKMRNALGWWWHTPHDLIDKIDPANLVRDTRIVVRALWQLLADPVLPLDYAADARALLAQLDQLTYRLAGTMTLDDLRTEAARLRDHATNLATEDPERANRALLLVSRALVPMDYTIGDRFAHDPALPSRPGRSCSRSAI